MTSNSKKLSANSRSVKLLRQWLVSGKLTGDEPPATVQRLSSVFSGYKLDNFRRAYNKLRKENGSPTDPPVCHDGDDSENLRQRCSEDVHKPMAKNPRIEHLTEVEDAENSDDESYDEIFFDLRSFKPIYMLSSWEERHTTTKRLSVAICLPSVVQCGDYSVRVLPGGMCLEMRCVWTNEFCNVESLHRKWLQSDKDRLEPYLPKLSGFDTFLKAWRKRNTDAVEQVARLQLAFDVESHIHKIHNMGWRDSTTRAVHLELRALVEEYGVKSANISFEIVQLMRK